MNVLAFFVFKLRSSVSIPSIVTLEKENFNSLSTMFLILFILGWSSNFLNAISIGSDKFRESFCKILLFILREVTESLKK